MLAHDEVPVDGRRVALQRWLGPALVDGCYYFDPLNDDPASALAPTDMIRAVSWRNAVLLIELRSRFPFEDERSHVAVVDLESGRLIGHFPGSCSGHNFPLAWRPVGPRTLDMDYAEGPPPLVP
ncbi:MAG: hypothetical protein M5U28_16435 [Sandaracinaceae bacterium]|nr:hypothetical protein [Sandaracinaceae bacterium]